jgi:hypothetical protein
MLMGGAFVVGMAMQVAAMLPLTRPQTPWENAPLDIAWQVRQGGAVYTDWRSGPVHVAVYGPAYYWMLGTIGRIAGLDRIGMIGLGRGLSVGAFAVAVVLLAMLAAKGGNRRWAWAIPLIALGWIPVQSVEFIASARPDMIALALSLVGLYLAMCDGRWTAAAAVTAFGVAVFSKSTAVAAPLAVALAMIWEPRRMRLLWLLGTFGAGVVAGVLALQAATGGLFWLHQQVTLAAPQKWAYALFVLTKGRMEDQPRLLAMMVAIAMLTRFVRPGFGGLPDSLRRPWRWATAYFFAATLVAILSARRQGSNINYLIEPTLAGGWVLALWARSLAVTADRSSRLVGRVLATVALLNPAPWYIAPHVTTARQIAQDWQLRADYEHGAGWLKGLPGPLLSLDPWLAYRSGVEGYVNDPIAFGSMSVTQPDRDVLTARVRERFFASVVTFGPMDAVPPFVHQEIRTPWPALETALRENYVLTERLDPWYRYAPK